MSLDVAGGSLTPAQQNWLDLRSGLFLHFGINTYYDVEWSDGTLDASRFNPASLDTDGWCSAAKAAGMRFVVLVTKHHDGFCNWPTSRTRYSVASTPWRRGAGDVIADLAESCDKHGLKLGLYYSLWDRNCTLHDTDDAAYSAFMTDQLFELLDGRYGPVVELWFDGMWSKMPDDWKRLSPADFQRTWREQAAPRWQWDRVYRHIKSLQPGCVVLNNTTTHFPGVPIMPVDARTGERAEQMDADQTVWEFEGQRHVLPLQIETTLSRKGPEGDFATGSWFYHPWDDTVAPREEILKWHTVARAKRAVLLINAPITPEGKLRDVDDRALRSLGG